VFLTIPTKVHNPSKRKQAVLDRAFLEYTRAFDHVLETAQANIDDVRKAFFWTGKDGRERLTSAQRAASYLSHLCPLGEFHLSGFHVEEGIAQ